MEGREKVFGTQVFNVRCSCSSIRYIKGGNGRHLGLALTFKTNTPCPVSGEGLGSNILMLR